MIPGIFIVVFVLIALLSLARVFSRLSGRRIARRNWSDGIDGVDGTPGGHSGHHGRHMSGGHMGGGHGGH